MGGLVIPVVEEVEMDRELLFILFPIVWGAFCLGWGLLLEHLTPGSGKEVQVPPDGGPKE
jgi:hypothetical protein